ncbi:MAG: response regulator transcription factor [Bacteroidota bacterium]
MAINILMVDDHKIVRDGLRSLLEKEPGIKVIGEASSGREAVRFVSELKPDVVILDIGMPDLNGIDATRQMKARIPAMKILALSMHSDKRFVARMFAAGASGYLLKDCAFEELARAIRTVAQDQTYLSPSITSQVIKDYVRHLAESDSAGLEILTPREREVIQLLAEGKSTKHVAAALNISVKTVETHRSQIMEKLNIDSIANLTKFAIREGLTSLEA